MTRSQTPTEGTRALAVEAGEGTQKSDGSQGIGKATSWVAQNDVGDSRKQATSQLPRWDNSEKFVQNQEEMDYTHNLRKVLYFEAAKENGKVGGDTNSAVGQQQQRRMEEVEVTSPVKPNINSLANGSIGLFDLGQSKEKKMKGKGRWKKLAREQNPKADAMMIAQESGAGDKRMGKIETIKAEEDRILKKTRETGKVPTHNDKLLSKTVVAAGQHCREP